MNSQGLLTSVSSFIPMTTIVSKVATFATIEDKQKEPPDEESTLVGSLAECQVSSPKSSCDKQVSSSKVTLKQVALEANYPLSWTLNHIVQILNRIAKEHKKSKCSLTFLLTKPHSKYWSKADKMSMLTLEFDKEDQPMLVRMIRRIYFEDSF